MISRRKHDDDVDPRSNGWRHRVGLTLTALILLAGACSTSDSGENTSTADGQPAEAMATDAGDTSDQASTDDALTGGAAPTTAPLTSRGDAANAEEAKTADAESPGSGGGLVPGGLEAVDYGRDIIFTAVVTVEVPDIPTATLQAVTAVQSAGGFVFGQQTSTEGTPVTVLVFKVPPDQFQQALADLGEVGFVLNQQISADDVTERVVDLQSRIITAEASVNRLRAFLDGATDLDAIAQLESELLRRETDLELLRGQLRTVEQQVSLATITLTIYQKEPGPDVELSETFIAGEVDGTAGDPACPGTDELTVAEGDKLTLCFVVHNTGDTPLTDLTITDSAFGVRARDVVAHKDDDDTPLAPGDQRVFSAVVEATSSRAAQGRVQATAVDAEGVAITGDVVVATSDAFLVVEPDTSLPGFMSGLSAGWDLLVRGLSAIVLAFGFLLPFLWILPLGWYLRRRFPRKAKVEPQPPMAPVQPSTPEAMTASPATPTEHQD